MAKYVLIAMILAQAFCEQPEVLKPAVPPSRSLPWGKLNFLHTTDTHGWYAGHFQEPQYSADWGDYISFTKRMREKADSIGVDLLVIDTGDRIEGNGLYDASDPKGKYSYDIFTKQDIDIMNSGNHELYYRDPINKERFVMAPRYKDNYLASNLNYIDPITGEQSPLAPRYRTFTTKNQGIRVAAFGFMFNFTRNANNSMIQFVEDAVKEEWFQTAIREDVDLFLVSTHVPLNAPEHQTIFKAIRSQNKDTPIQFFGAHTHVRNFVKYDSKSYGIQSGRYMETIGWMSIDWKNDTNDLRALEEISFQRRYIDSNLLGYQYHTGLNATTFPTELGKNVSLAIYEARKNMDLDHIFGCSPRDLFLRGRYPSNQSALSWLEEEVLPDVATVPERANVPRLVILNSPFIRFDIHKGTFTRDTSYTVTPFINQFRYIRDVPYQSAKGALDLLNNGGSDFAPVKRSLGLAAPRVPSMDPIIEAVPGNDSAPNELPYSWGYVTKDDAGSDGDDTIHSPIPYYAIPNCVRSQVNFPADGEPETVDVVFGSFIEPFLINALNHNNLNYTKDDTQIYREGSISDLLNQWIEKNWPC